MIQHPPTCSRCRLRPGCKLNCWRAHARINFPRSDGALRIAKTKRRNLQLRNLQALGLRRPHAGVNNGIGVDSDAVNLTYPGAYVSATERSYFVPRIRLCWITSEWLPFSVRRLLPAHDFLSVYRLIVVLRSDAFIGSYDFGPRMRLLRTLFVL